MPKYNEYSAITSSGVDTDDLILVEVDGVTKKMTIAEAESLFGGSEVFTALSGTTWDGSAKSKTLTGNLALTLSTTRQNGILRVKQDGTGSRTLSISGQSLSINTAADSTTYISFLYDAVLNDYTFFVNTNGVVVAGIVGPDVTAPTIVSITVEDSNPSEIVITYNEALNAAAVPTNSNYILNEASPGSGFTGTPVVTGSTVKLTLSTPMANGDVWDLGYTGSTVEDVAGNNAGTFATQPITNNVAGGMDADTTAYITAEETLSGGTISTGDKNAVNTHLVTAFKTAGVWASKLKLAYPVLGSGKLNLRNPVDSDAANRLSTVAGSSAPTFNATGIVYTGTQALDTHLIPAVTLTDHSETHIFAFTGSAGAVFGVSDGLKASYYLITATPASGDHYIQGKNSLMTGDVTSGLFEFLIRTNGTTENVRCWKNNSIVHTNDYAEPDVAAATTLRSIYLGANNNDLTTQLLMTGTIKAYFLLTGLTDAERTAVHSAVAAYLTAVGR